jgi:hypothetical protein
MLCIHMHSGKRCRRRREGCRDNDVRREALMHFIPLPVLGVVDTAASPI